MVVIGLLGANVVNAADKISEAKIKELMNMKKSNKQECIYEEPKERFIKISIGIYQKQR